MTTPSSGGGIRHRRVTKHAIVVSGSIHLNSHTLSPDPSEWAHSHILSSKQHIQAGSGIFPSYLEPFGSCGAQKERFRESRRKTPKSYPYALRRLPATHVGLDQLDEVSICKKVWRSYFCAQNFDIVIRNTLKIDITEKVSEKVTELQVEIWFVLTIFIFDICSSSSSYNLIVTLNNSGAKFPGAIWP